MNREQVGKLMGKLSAADLTLYYPGGQQNEFWSAVLDSPSYEQDVRAVKAEGARLLGTQTPELTYELFSEFEREGKRLGYEHVYFARRRRLNTFALLSLFEPENLSYLEELCEIIWAICDEYTWCLPAHLKDCEADKTIDLFSSETGFTLSEISLLLGERFPPLLRNRIAAEVSDRLFVPYLEHGPHHWETAKHNWSAVCAGSIGAAALLQKGPLARLEEIVTKVLGSMNCYLEGFGEDGVCQEGVGYWNYGFGYYVYFSDLLKRRTQGRLNLFASFKVHQIALFQQKVYLYGNAVANFSDSVPFVGIQIGLTHYLANIYPDMEVPSLEHRTEYTDDHCSRWAPALRNFIWLDSSKQTSDWASAAYYMVDAQWLVSRHETNNGRFGFAVKAGHNGEPHNHNDVGHFILMGEEAIIAADLGCGEYTQAYFGAGRYDYDCNGSQGHSVPIIDGFGQVEGEGHAAENVKVQTGAGEDYMALELSGAYNVPHLRKLKRKLVWHKTDMPWLSLEDKFTFSSVPRRITERIVTRCRPTVMENGIVGLSNGADQSASIRYDTHGADVLITARSYSDHFGQASEYYTIDFELKELSLVNRFSLTIEMKE
ncbi:hypothetical protein [Cohnella sp.]|uniref:hypothetical protein n=1 Tax=Cohnella sp. TaxID=1883426 RepID=UPI0035630E1B